MKKTVVNLYTYLVAITIYHFKYLTENIVKCLKKFMNYHIKSFLTQKDKFTVLIDFI